jgi:sulfopyruvate decarboxylase alpha subunit
MAPTKIASPGPDRPTERPAGTVTSAIDWSRDAFESLQSLGVTVAATVPDAGLVGVLDLCREAPGFPVVTLSTEQEGVGLLCGLWLGGRRGVLLLQSSGLGNCVNALSLPAATRSPCLMLVTMRGQWAEFNPWQVPMGQAAPTVLKAMGAKCFAVDEPLRVGETVAAAGELAFHGGYAAAVLIHQRVVGAKTFAK